MWHSYCHATLTACKYTHLSAAVMPCAGTFEFPRPISWFSPLVYCIMSWPVESRYLFVAIMSLKRNNEYDYFTIFYPVYQSILFRYFPTPKSIKISP